MSRTAQYAVKTLIVTAVKTLIVTAVAAVATVLTGPAAEAMTFNPDAPLDTTTIDDQRAPERVGTLTVVPELSVPYVVACQADYNVCAPDESPDGGPIDSIGEDGTASYRDGWTITPTTATIAGTVVGEWTAPRDDTAPVRTVSHTSAPRPAAGSCSEPAPVPAGGTTSSTPAPKPQPGPQTQPLVNLNTATYAQIMALPHIDKVLTDRIVAQRAVQPFASLDDMRHRVSRFPSAVTALVTV
jgi:hypothetical protein